MYFYYDISIDMVMVNTTLTNTTSIRNYLDWDGFKESSSGRKQNFWKNLHMKGDARGAFCGEGGCKPSKL